MTCLHNYKSPIRGSKTSKRAVVKFKTGTLSTQQREVLPVFYFINKYDCRKNAGNGIGNGYGQVAGGNTKY